MSTPDEVRALVARYAAGSLSAEDEALLLRAALVDQELFDELVAEQALRDALDLPGARARVLALLEASAAGAPGAGVATWRSSLRWALPSLAAAALIAIVGLRFFGERSPVPSADPGDAEPAVSSAAPERPRARSLGTPAPVGEVPIPTAVLVLNKPGERPTYKIGEAFRSGVRVSTSIAVFLDEVGPAGAAARRLFPAEGAVSLPAGRDIVLPPASVPALVAKRPPGVHRVRLREAGSGRVLAEVSFTVR